MSEHTEGRVVVHQSGARAFLLNEKDDDVAFDISKEDARRLAACWNMFFDIDTDVIEIMPTFIEFQQANEQTLHEALSELNAARALLREVLESDDEAISDAQMAGIPFPTEITVLTDRIRSYLDACDTLEGKS